MPANPSASSSSTESAVRCNDQIVKIVSESKGRIQNKNIPALVDSSSESEETRWTPGLRMKQNRTYLSFDNAVER